MARVLVVSDETARELTVHRLRSLAPDLVLSAGDLPYDYLEFLGDATDAALVRVRGNHDPVPPTRGEIRDLERTGLGRRPWGWRDADQVVLEAAGLRIAGLGGCVRYNNGPNQYTQAQYDARARRLVRRARTAGPVDVLLTHTPPLGLGDDEDRPHVGIAALHRVLDRLEPTWHLHGHVHPHGRTLPDRQVGPTTLRNVIPWTVLEIEPRRARDRVGVSERPGPPTR